MFAAIYWNPHRVAFQIPYVHCDIYWYSLCFAVGLSGGYLISLFYFLTFAKGSSEERCYLHEWMDGLALWIFLAIFIGARLAHIIFYDYSYYIHNPMHIFFTRQGGLSSHGGVIGIFIAIWAYYRKHPLRKELSWKSVLDCIAIGSAWTATWIRLGNFCNQEIIGSQTSLPWGVAFGAPIDYGTVSYIAYHPVQLYEAAAAAFSLLMLATYYKSYLYIAPGKITGLYLTFLFTLRIILEIIKSPQSEFDTTYLHMGQVLSIPFLIFGIYLLRSKK